MGQDKPDIDTIRARRDEVAERHGPWTSHDIQLAEGISTRPGGADLDRLRRCLQIASDVLRRPLGELRVLDLGALEGQYAVEFAAHGAEAVAVEGREANIEKARVAKEALGLDRLELLRRTSARSAASGTGRSTSCSASACSTTWTPTTCSRSWVNSPTSATAS